MARSAIPAMLRRIADDGVVDVDTESYLRTAAERLEECEDDAHRLLDAIAAAELELRDRLVARAVSGGDRA